MTGVDKPRQAPVSESGVASDAVSRCLGAASGVQFGAADPVTSEPQQGVVLFWCADGDPDTVAAVGADNDACIGGLFHESWGAGGKG